MLVDSTRAENVFRKVHALKTHKSLLCLDGDRLPVSVKDLTWVVGDAYGLRIAVEEVAFPGQIVRSVVERYADGSARIYVRQNLGLDLKRLAVVKELMHLVIDEREDWSPRGVETIQSFLSEIAVPGKKAAQSGAQSELLAEVAAVEILYPFEFRDNDRNMLAAGSTTIAKLALHYGVPGFAISHGLETFHPLAAEMWSRLIKAAA